MDAAPKPTIAQLRTAARLTAATGRLQPLVVSGGRVVFRWDERAILVLLVNLYGLPIAHVYAERDAHRAEAHRGRPDDGCAMCGFLDAAVYKAQTGRHVYEAMRDDTGGRVS